MGFLAVLGTVAGTAIGGPAGAAIGNALGSAIEGNVAANRAAGASRAAARAQQEAAQRATADIRSAVQQGLGRLEPFAQVGQRGVDLSGFLASPEQQFQFLQSNPLFQLGLENANRLTQQSAAARGRLSAGDTLEQLTNNSLLVASPLIDRQRQDILNLLNIGQNTANAQNALQVGSETNIGNLTTGAGAAEAAGIVGANNAKQQGMANVFGSFDRLAGNQDFQDFIGGLFGSTPPPSGGFSNAPIGPLP